MDPLRHSVNLTTTFILPLLYDKGLKHSDILTDSFINAYIADLNRPEQDNKMLVNYITITDLPKWTNDYTVYETDNGSFMVSVEIPDNFIDDHGRFLMGDYSKFSDEHKDRVIKFWEAHDNLLTGVLFRGSEELNEFMKKHYDTDFELLPPETEQWNPPNLKKEIFGMAGE